MEITKNNIWMINTDFVKSQPKIKPDELMHVSASNNIPLLTVDGLAIINVSGPISKKPDIFMSIFGGSSSELIIEAFKAAVSDSSIKQILMVIDSPGGTVDGLSELGDVIFNARKKKPVTAQVTGLAASAAYYVASQATTIFVQRTDLVGSIGTRMSLVDASEAFEKEGIKIIPIDTGEFKSAGEFGTEITDAQIAEFQRIVNFFFDDFVNAIVRGRNITERRVRALADGRMFTPDQALESKLIDGVQTLDKTVDMLIGAIRAESRRNTRLAALKYKLVCS